MVEYYQFKGPAVVMAQRAKDIVEKKARDQIGPEIDVRDLRPEDFGISNPTWAFAITATSSDTNVISAYTVTTNRFIAVYGVKYSESTPLFSRIKITSGGGLKMDRNIETLPNTTDCVMFFDPVFIDSNTSLTVTAYNNTTSTSAAETLVFVGIVAERKGMVLMA